MSLSFDSPSDFRGLVIAQGSPGATWMLLPEALAEGAEDPRGSMSTRIDLDQ